MCLIVFLVKKYCGIVVGLVNGLFMFYIKCGKVFMKVLGVIVML